MMDDVKDDVQRISGAEKRLLALRRKLKWWTAVLVLVVAVALGLVAMAAYPNLLPEVIREKIASIGSKVQSSTAYLGVEIQDLNESVAEALGLRTSSGVVITRVIASSPAAESGLKRGDIILRHDRLRVKNSSELQDMLAEASPRDRARIVVDRDGQVRTLYIELGQRPSYLMRTAYTSPGQTDSNPEWGCTLSPLTPELARQLSLPSSIKGVVVVAVASSGLAKAAGVLPGDVIVSVNRQPAKDLAAFYKAIENQQSVVLQIYRSGRVMYVQLNVSSASPPLATIAGSVAENAPLPQCVAVAANGSDLNAQLAMRFGTAPYFVIADLNTNRFVAIQNNTLADSRGYGIAAAQLVAAQGAGAAIAGAYGPQAYDALKTLNVIPFTANQGKVSDVLSQYRSALLTQVTDPTLPGYGYARSIIATGGSPFSSEEEDEEEEEGGYKGMPYTIPPQGKYDPELDPANALQTTAGSSQRTEYCYCPTCRILVPHPPSVACSGLACPQCGNRLMNWDSGSLAPGASAPSANYGQVPTPTQSQLRTGSTGTAVVPGVSPGASGTLNLNQQTQFCYCPICNVVHEHPAGVPCSSLVCSACGSRLISLNPGSRSPLPAAQTSAGTVIAGQPGTIPPMGQTSAGTVIAGQPGTIPPMGQITAGSDLPTGVLQGTIDGNCVCPKCGTTVPHVRGTACYTIPCPRCGTLMVREGAVVNPSGVTPQYQYIYPNIYPTGQTSAGITVAGPTNIPPGGQQQMGTSRGQTSTGTVVGGQPETIPPTGQASAGTTLPTGVLQGTIDGNCVCPKCGTTVPHVRGTACYTIPCPRCGTFMVGEGAVVNPSGVTPQYQYIYPNIYPMGQTSAGTVVGGQPETIPPTGQASAGTTLPTGVLQGTIDGNCVCPKCGTTVPHVRGTACYTIPCPRCGTFMVGEGAVVNPSGVTPQYQYIYPNIYPTGQTSAGTVVGGQPETIPPTGQASAGTTLPTGVLQGTIDGNCVCPTCGTTVPHVRGTACYTIPCPRCGTFMVGEGVVMGQTSAGVTVAGIPNISTGTVVGGQPETIPPMGMGQMSALTTGDPASTAVTVAAEDSGRICIAAAGATMDAPVAALFDRATHFLIVGLGSFKAIPNPNAGDLIGAGVQSAQLAVSEGARAVITDDIGVKAMEELARLRVRVYTGVNASANQAMAWYQDGRLAPSSLNASVADDEEHGPPSSSKAKAKGESSSRTL